MLIVLSPFLFSVAGEYRTLVIGDSYVGRLAGQNIQLRGGGEVSWYGRGGKKISDLRWMMNTYLNRRRVPTTIIIHIASNDIFEDKTSAIVSRATESLKALRQLYPDTRLIWSDIVDRAFFLGESSPGAGVRATKIVNRGMHRACLRIDNTYFIGHSRYICAAEHALYRRDGIHLSEEGSQILVLNWENALCYFNENPDSYGYPPLE